ncbi:EF hand domain-containing protein [Roseibium hamelinense]|uniref:EF hand domain-containing protein n=1 Tax=Roseibium hamelinense TaxID=150831 RepID=A0A562SVI9_9HYPH|nr:EF-hand domain-containing protein [Roseibium hamelinense]TWI84826.1 EF hand domain-containing protein [Roseibium hamelinense]
MTTYRSVFGAIGLLALGGLPATASSQTAETAARNYQAADQNDDGVLVYEEFVSFIDMNAAANLGNARRVQSRGLYARAFKRLDGNGDGFVTPVELQNAAR